MPADNEMPEFVQAEVRISRAWVKTDQDRAVVWLTDALDRAQRERDEAVNAYEKTMIQRDMARNELAGERRSHEMLANLRRNQLLVNAALQKECDAMRKLVTEAIGWDEEAIDGEQLSAAIAEYRASHTLPEGK